MLKRFFKRDEVQEEAQEEEVLETAPSSSSLEVDVIEPGLYTIEEICTLLGFDVRSIEDRRRVKISRLGWDYYDQAFRVSDGAEIVEITLDGEVVASANVAR